MNKYTQWLAGLLALQLIAVLGLYWSDKTAQTQHQVVPLLSFEKATIDKVVISEPDQSVVLQRSSGRWLLTDDKLPINETQFDSLINKLAALTTTWPVTTTNASHERFEVSDDKFQRRLELYQGEVKAGELFLGTSPGFRKSHIRRVNEDETYSVELNAHDLPTKNSQWLDKTLVAAKSVSSIKGSDFALSKDAETWQFSGHKNIKDGDEDKSSNVDKDKAQQLAQAITSLQITDIAREAPEIPEGEIKVFEVSDGNNKWTYQFMKKDNTHYVQRNDINKFFTLSQYDYERIANSSLASLTMSEDDPVAKSREEEEKTQKSDS